MNTDPRLPIAPTKVIAISDLEISRQTLRRMGHQEIRDRLKEMFPLFSRREIRGLASQLHVKAWEGRDGSAVDKLLHRSRA